MQTIKKIKVKNFVNDRGNTIPNQLIIHTPEGLYFQSYETIIALKKYTELGLYKIYLDEHYWDYSNTTGKYRNLFLNETKSETLKKIKSGEYKLVDLNGVN